MGKGQSTKTQEETAEYQDVAVEETEDNSFMLQMLKDSIEENQTRRILDILNDCYSITEAKEKIKRLLKPVPEYRQATKSILEKDKWGKSDEANKIKTIRINDACERYGLKRATIMKLAEDAESVIRIGRAVLINVPKLDSYLDMMSGE